MTYVLHINPHDCNFSDLNWPGYLAPKKSDQVVVLNPSRARLYRSELTAKFAAMVKSWQYNGATVQPVPLAKAKPSGFPAP